MTWIGSSNISLKQSELSCFNLSSVFLRVYTYPDENFENFWTFLYADIKTLQVSTKILGTPRHMEFGPHW